MWAVTGRGKRGACVELSAYTGDYIGRQESKRVSVCRPANPHVFWLPDLGSNQGPTD